MKNSHFRKVGWILSNNFGSEKKIASAKNLIVDNFARRSATSRGIIGFSINRQKNEQYNLKCISSDRITANFKSVVEFLCHKEGRKKERETSVCKGPPTLISDFEDNSPVKENVVIATTMEVDSRILYITHFQNLQEKMRDPMKQ